VNNAQWHDQKGSALEVLEETNYHITAECEELLRNSENSGYVSRHVVIAYRHIQYKEFFYRAMHCRAKRGIEIACR